MTGRMKTSHIHNTACCCILETAEIDLALLMGEFVS